MKGGVRANLGRVLWSALQLGEVQSFILVFFLFSLSLPLALSPSLPLSLSVSFVQLNLSFHLSSLSVSLKKDEKPFDSQFLSRIFHSDAKAEGRGGKRGRVIRVLGGVRGGGLGGHGGGGLQT